MDVYKIKYEKVKTEYDHLKNNNNNLMQRCNNLKTLLKELRSKRNALINKLDACGDNYMEFIKLHNAQATERLNNISMESVTLCNKSNNEVSISTPNNALGHPNQKVNKNDTKNINNKNLGHIIKALEKNNLNMLAHKKNFIGIVPNEMLKSNNLDNSHQHLSNLKKTEIFRERKIKVKRSKINKPLKHQLVPYPNLSVAYTPVPISCFNANILNVNNLTPNAIILTNIQTQPLNNPSYYSLVSQGNVYLLGNSSLHQPSLLNMKGNELNKQNLPLKITTSTNISKTITCSNYLNHILPLYASPSPINQKSKLICHLNETKSNLVPITLPSCSILPLPISKNYQMMSTSKSQYTNTQTTTSYLSYNDYLDSLLNKTVVSNLLSENSNFVNFQKLSPPTNCIKPVVNHPPKDNAINAVSHHSSILPKVILPKTL